MDWTLSKKVVILILFIVNISLFVINYTQKERYIITSAQERNIVQLLSKNGIALECDFDIVHAPMPRLEFKAFSYSKSSIEKAFFNNDLTIQSSIDNQIVYQNQYKQLFLNNSYGVYVKKFAEWTTIAMEELEAIQIATDEIAPLEYLFGELKQSQSYYTSQGWIVEFNGLQDDLTIFSNKLRVFVSDSGVYKIEFYFLDIIGSNGSEQDIISVDEALMCFLRYWKNKEAVPVIDINANIFREGTVIDCRISSIELGYYLHSQRDWFVGTRFYMEPYYGIYLIDDDITYLIDAYNGNIILQ